MSEYDGMPLDVVAGRCAGNHHLIDGECSECGKHVFGTSGWSLIRGEWPNPPIIESAEEQYGEMINEPEFTEADLLRLAGQLEAAIEQGWVFKRYLPCGDREHRHSWRFTAWLCGIIRG